MVHTLIKRVVFVAFFVVGSGMGICSQTKTTTTYVKHGMYTVVVNFCNENQTCTIEQYNNVGTNLIKGYHKDKYSYVRKGDNLILHSCSKNRLSIVGKNYIDAYYSLCFYPKTQIEGMTNGESIFPALISQEGVVANWNGYYYTLPNEIRADLLFSDSCMFLRLGNDEGILLLKSSVGDENPMSASSVEGAVANASGWTYFWNNRKRPSEVINPSRIIGHIFIHEKDTIGFEKGGVGYLYDSHFLRRDNFKYKLCGPYVVIMDNISVDTLLYRDGALYEAKVYQSKESAPRTLCLNGIRQEPTGNMTISVYADSSIGIIDEKTIFMNIREYYFPINFRSWVW